MASQVLLPLSHFLLSGYVFREAPLAFSGSHPILPSHVLFPVSHWFLLDALESL